MYNSYSDNIVSLLSLEFDGRGRFLYKSLKVYVLELVYDPHKECVMYHLPHFGCVIEGSGYTINGHTHFT